MFKKLAATLMAVCLFNVQATLPVDQAKMLSQAFDNLNYSLSVDWDQQDRSFYDAQVKDFEKTIEGLQEAGMSNEDLINFAKAQLVDKKLEKDMDQLFAVVEANKLTKAEARAYILETLSKKYSTGASWIGGRNAFAANLVLILLIAAVIVAAGSGTSSGGTYYDDGYTCYDDYVCYDYYDSWGDYYYTDCYWDTYCY